MPPCRGVTISTFKSCWGNGEMREEQRKKIKERSPITCVWHLCRGSPVHLKKEKGGAIRITKQLRPHGESCKSSLIPPKHLLYHMVNAWLESQRYVSYLCREHVSYTDMSFERLQCFHVSGVSWSHWNIEISHKNPGFWFSLENGKTWTHWALTLCGNLSSS